MQKYVDFMTRNNLVKLFFIFVAVFNIFNFDIILGEIYEFEISYKLLVLKFSFSFPTFFKYC